MSCSLVEVYWWFRSACCLDHCLNYQTTRHNIPRDSYHQEWLFSSMFLSDMKFVRCFLWTHHWHVLIDSILKWALRFSFQWKCGLWTGLWCHWLQSCRNPADDGSHRPYTQSATSCLSKGAVAEQAGNQATSGHGKGSLSSIASYHSENNVYKV
jgi:hypothetical protein